MPIHANLNERTARRSFAEARREAAAVLARVWTGEAVAPARKARAAVPRLRRALPRTPQQPLEAVLAQDLRHLHARAPVAAVREPAPRPHRPRPGLGMVRRRQRRAPRRRHRHRATTAIYAHLDDAARRDAAARAPPLRPNGPDLSAALPPRRGPNRPVGAGTGTGGTGRFSVGIHRTHTLSWREFLLISHKML